MKKILLIANYFYPEVASTGQLLTEMCEGLQKNFDITVICEVPCYTGKRDDTYQGKKIYYEKYKNINVIRVDVPEFDKKNKKSRIKYILKYFFNSRKAIRKLEKFDIIMTISQPPVLGGMLGVYAKRKLKGKLVYLIEDFNPEQTLAVNYSKNKFVTNIMMYFDKKTCKKADLVITVGRDMQETLIKRFNDKKVPNNVVINNWINEKEVYPLNKDNNKIVEFKKKYDLIDKFIIMYSGNVGLYYDLENIIKLLKKYKDNDDIVFAIIGEGAVRQKLIDYCKDNKMNNVRFIPYQNKEDLIYSLNTADVHLVTNSKGIKGVSVPSKIYGCMATNAPILGILEEGSEAWQIIDKSKCGILAHTGNYEEIEKSLDEIVKNKNKFVTKYLTGRKYLEDNFTRDKSIEKYKEELIKLEK